MATSTSATSANANIVSATLTSVTSDSATSRTSENSGGIGSASSTISSATTATAAVAKPGFFGKVSAFACNIIDKICKAFEKCFASIKRLFGRPAATISREKQVLMDLKKRLEREATGYDFYTTLRAKPEFSDSCIFISTMNYDFYTTLLVKPEFGDDKLLEDLKHKTYELAKEANNDMGVENGFGNSDWAGEAIKRYPTNKYVLKALENMIESAE